MTSTGKAMIARAAFAMTVAAGFLAPAAVGPAGAAEWIMASGYPEENFLTKNVRLFIDDVAQKSDGALTIDLQPNDSLIKIDSIKRAVQSGQIPIGEIRLGIYGNEDPMYVLGGLPFIAPTYDDAWDLKDAQKPYFDKMFDEAGMKVLFYQPWPGQGFYTSFPVTSLDDFKGVKLRIYSTATQKMGELLGFQATVLPFAEIPQAFSTGLIDALFTSPQTGIDIQAWDYTKHFTDTGAIYSKNAVIVSKAAWDELDEKTQGVILEAAKEAEARAWTMSKEVNDDQQKMLADNGMTVAMAPEPVIARMKEIGKVMLADWEATASPEALAAVKPYFEKREME